MPTNRKQEHVNDKSLPVQSKGRVLVDASFGFDGIFHFFSCFETRAKKSYTEIPEIQ